MLCRAKGVRLLAAVVAGTAHWGGSALADDGTSKRNNMVKPVETAKPERKRETPRRQDDDRPAPVQRNLERQPARQADNPQARPAPVRPRPRVAPAPAPEPRSTNNLVKPVTPSPSSSPRPASTANDRPRDRDRNRDDGPRPRATADRGPERHVDLAPSSVNKLQKRVYVETPFSPRSSRRGEDWDRDDRWRRNRHGHSGSSFGLGIGYTNSWWHEPVGYSPYYAGPVSRYGPFAYDLNIWGSSPSYSTFYRARPHAYSYGSRYGYLRSSRYRFAPYYHRSFHRSHYYDCPTPLYWPRRSYYFESYDPWCDRPLYGSSFGYAGYSEYASIDAGAEPLMPDYSTYDGGSASGIVAPRALGGSVGSGAVVSDDPDLDSRETRLLEELRRIDAERERRELARSSEPSDGDDVRVTRGNGRFDPVPEAILAVSDTERGDYAGAVQVMRRAVSGNPEAFARPALRDRARDDRELDQRVRYAIHRYQSAPGRLVSDADAKFMIATLRSLLGERDEALGAAQAALRAGDQKQSTRELIRALETRDDAARAQPVQTPTE